MTLDRRTDPALAESLTQITRQPARDAREFLGLILRAAIGLTGSGSGYVFLCDGERDRAFLVGALRLGDKSGVRDEPRTSMPLADLGRWAEAIRRDRPIVIDAAEATLLKGDEFPAGVSRFTRSMAIPFRDGDRPVGLLCLTDKDEDYDAVDEERTSTFAQAAWRISENLRNMEAGEWSDSRVQSILSSLVEAYFEHDLHGVFTYVNDAACVLTGYEREELLGHSFRMLVSPETEKRMREVARRIFETGTPGALVDYEVVRKDGSRATHQASSVLKRDQRGRPVGFRVLTRDVTQKKRAERALERSERHARALFESIPVPTLVWNRKGDDLVLEELNEAARHFTRGKFTNQVGSSATELFSSMPQIPADLHQCLANGRTIETDFWYQTEEADPRRYVVVQYAPVLPDGVLMHITDITRQKQAEEYLRYISVRDALTDLHNRFYTEVEIDRLIKSRISPISVVVADLNDLKIINDTEGHAAGDAYLVNAATVLRQTFRPEDVVARTGGDEFLVILPSVDEAVCRQAIARLERNVAQFNQAFDPPLSIAVGVATTRVAANLREAIKIADRRMYENKAAMKVDRAGLRSGASFPAERSRPAPREAPDPEEDEAEPLATPDGHDSADRRC